MAVRVVERRWPTTAVVVLAAGVPGLLVLAAVERIARWLDTTPGLVEYTTLGLTWNLCLLALLAVWVTRIEGQPLRELVTRWWRREHAEERVERPVVTWVLIAVLCAFGLTSIRLELIDAGWDVLAGPSWSINSPTANRGDAGFSIGAGVIAYQILIRIPLTVFVEESLFRGWVQERHGAVASGSLFAAYHLAQWWTIPALIPFGVALSLMRYVTRSIWPGAVLHGMGNVVYAFGLR